MKQFSGKNYPGFKVVFNYSAFFCLFIFSCIFYYIVHSTSIPGRVDKKKAYFLRVRSHEDEISSSLTNDNKPSDKWAGITTENVNLECTTSWYTNRENFSKLSMNKFFLIWRSISPTTAFFFLLFVISLYGREKQIPLWIEYCSSGVCFVETSIYRAGGKLKHSDWLQCLKIMGTGDKVEWYLYIERPTSSSTWHYNFRSEHTYFHTLHLNIFTP